MWGLKKTKEPDDKGGFYIKVNGTTYTESQIQGMELADLDTLITKVDLAIDDCQSYIDYMESDSISTNTEKIEKSKYALGKLKKGRTFCLAIRRQKAGNVKQDIEHYFMKAAKRVLTENQYNRIMVKAQAEYEVDNS